MSREDIQMNVATFKRARMQWLIMTAVTLVNILICALTTSFYLPFTASFPKVLIGLARGNVSEGATFAQNMAANTWVILAAVGSIAILVAFLVIGLKSRDARKLSFVMLGLLIADSIALIAYFIYMMAFDVFMVLDLATHVWLIIQLLQAVKATGQLKKVSEKEIYDATHPKAHEPSVGL